MVKVNNCKMKMIQNVSTGTHERMINLSLSIDTIIEIISSVNLD